MKKMKTCLSFKFLKGFSMIHSVMWINLENILQNEIGWSQKTTYLLYDFNLYKISRSQILQRHRVGSGCLGLEEVGDRWDEKRRDY